MDPTLHLETHYGDDPVRRAALGSLLNEVFKFDLQLLVDGGFWDPGYTPFSWFDEDGRASLSMPVPAHLDVVGTTLYWQAFFLERLPFSNLEQTTFTGM